MRSIRSAPLRWRRAAPRRMTPRTTASCTHAASSTSTATAGRSCGWTQRRRSGAPRRSRPRCRTPTPRPDPPPRSARAPSSCGTAAPCNLRNGAGRSSAAARLRLRTPRPADDPSAGVLLQLIEFHTRDLDRVRALVEKWRQGIGREATARWALISADRDRAGTYIELIAFPDFASAMRNSEHPVTNEFAKRMHEATEGEAGFRNLDVQELVRM